VKGGRAIRSASPGVQGKRTGQGGRHTFCTPPHDLPICLPHATHRRDGEQETAARPGANIPEPMLDSRHMLRMCFFPNNDPGTIRSEDLRALAATVRPRS